jgi:hypothetical protein
MGILATDEHGFSRMGSFSGSVEVVTRGAEVSAFAAIIPAPMFALRDGAGFAEESSYGRGAAFLAAVIPHFAQLVAPLPRKIRPVRELVFDAAGGFLDRIYKMLRIIRKIRFILSKSFHFPVSVAAHFAVPGKVPAAISETNWML